MMENHVALPEQEQAEPRSSTAHTPGPWKLLPTARPSQWLVMAGDDTMDRYNGDSFSIQFNEANARLIAAAPDLLKACRFALADCENDDFGASELAIQLRTAIAKATGEKL